MKRAHQAYVGHKIGILLAEGRDQPQAIAIAFSMARKKFGKKAVPAADGREASGCGSPTSHSERK